MQFVPSQTPPIELIKSERAKEKPTPIQIIIRQTSQQGDEASRRSEKNMQFSTSQ